MENLLPTCNYIFLISIRVLFLLILFKIFISLNRVKQVIFLWSVITYPELYLWHIYTGKYIIYICLLFNICFFKFWPEFY